MIGGNIYMISDLFKSICHDAPKRVIKRHDVEENHPNVERLTQYQAQALRNYRAERERFERERERREHEDLMLFVRLSRGG